MKIPQRKRERIAQLSADVLWAWERLQKQERSFTAKESETERMREKLRKYEERLTELTNEFTPDELIEQITDENFQALNCAGDFGNKELER